MINTYGLFFLLILSSLTVNAGSLKLYRASEVKLTPLSNCQSGYAVQLRNAIFLDDQGKKIRKRSVDLEVLRIKNKVSSDAQCVQNYQDTLNKFINNKKTISAFSDSPHSLYKYPKSNSFFYFPTIFQLLENEESKVISHPNFTRDYYFQDGKKKRVFN